jgi:hypothetical protein
MVDGAVGFAKVARSGLRAEAAVGPLRTRRMELSILSPESPTVPGIPQTTADYPGVASLSPMMPATMRPRLARRPALADSPNRMMPRMAVPTAPTPTHTA